MVRYPKYILLTSFSLALLIFIAGIFLGYSLDNFKSNEVLENIKQNELNTESYLAHQAFLDAFGGDECQALTNRITNMKFLVAKIAGQISQYSQSSMFSSEDDLDYLKRKYFISEVKFLSLLQNLKQKCDKDFVVILFFYRKDDPQSTRQGYVLDELSETYEESLIVLSFDKDYPDEPLVETLIFKYNITYAPTLIIDNDFKKQGLTSKEELQYIIENQLA